MVIYFFKYHLKIFSSLRINISKIVFINNVHKLNAIITTHFEKLATNQFD